MREFDTGATRDSDDGKLDYEGFFSPAVLKRRAEYMHKHRMQADGVMRDSDNWQKGIPLDQYMKSGWRHFWEWWAAHRGSNLAGPDVDIVEAICALMFNLEGYLHEYLDEQAEVEQYEEWHQKAEEQLTLTDCADCRTARYHEDCPATIVVSNKAPTSESLRK